MRTIGIDVDDGLTYEGQNNRGRIASPQPTIFVATTMPADADAASIPEEDDLGYAKFVFREDAFDAVTRLRRGRFYSRGDASQPHQWYVKNPTQSVGALEYPKLLHGFRTWRARGNLSTGAIPSIVALGIRSAFTLWRVIEIERIVTGEDLVTLKARGSMGLLPELNLHAIPLQELSRVTGVLDTLVQSAHSESAGSVVESARKAGQCCLGVWLSALHKDDSLNEKDIGELIKKLPEDATVMRSVAHVIGRFHVREKPNEKVRLGLRSVVEGDADFAITAISLLLREFEWAQ